MNRAIGAGFIALVLAFVFPPSRSGAKTGTIAVWDTGQSSPRPLASEAFVSATGWTMILQETTATVFIGDAVISNDRVVVVVRNGGIGAEVYSLRPDGTFPRARLVPVSTGGKPAVSLRRVALVENTTGGACLEARYRTAAGGDVTARFRIKPEEVAVETSAGGSSAGSGTARLRVECDGRYAVLPDFFADDLDLDASKIPVPAVSVPSDSFILNLAGNGNSIVVCVFENRNQDVRMTLSGVGEGRNFTGSEIVFGKKQKIWVALLEGAGIWKTAAVEPGDAGKEIRLDWKMPFPAVWRVDFTREDGLTDSWEMLLQEKKGGEYVKPGWVGGEDNLDSGRKRWTTVLGEFPYPAWSDSEGRGYLQPLDIEELKELKFSGPVVIYPINRVERTPSDTFTVVDVMRNSLGVGPCEYVLDLEGQKDAWPGEATCGVRDTLVPIYEKGEQKAKRAEVARTIDGGLVFVKFIRSRINQYVKFGHELQQYLALQKLRHPDQKKLLVEMDALAHEIDTRVAARRKMIETPGYVARMNEQFRKQVLGYEGPDALDKCKEYTEALVHVGSNQDELVGECRWVVKAIRQRGGILVATDPQFGPIARHIRSMTEKVLRKPAGHEGARH